MKYKLYTKHGHFTSAGIHWFKKLEKKIGRIAEDMIEDGAAYTDVLMLLTMEMRTPISAARQRLEVRQLMLKNHGITIPTNRKKINKRYFGKIVIKGKGK